MGDKGGRKDKSKKEKQTTAQHTLKEKRKLKKRSRFRALSLRGRRIVPRFIANNLQWLSIGPWAGPHLLLSRTPFKIRNLLCSLALNKPFCPRGL
jgi:hypothetical protein